MCGVTQVRQNVDKRVECETHSLKMWIRVASLHSDARLRIALQSPQNALQSHFRVSLQFREENSARGEFCCLESRILSFWQNVKGQNVRSKLNSSRVPAPRRLRPLAALLSQYCTIVLVLLQNPIAARECPWKKPRTGATPSLQRPNPRLDARVVSVSSARPEACVV